MRSEIILVNSPHPVELKETYATLKRRLSNESAFMEMTDKRGKITVSKMAIISLMALEKVVKKKVKKSV